MLSEIYGWFTEGFDTKDLQEARRYWRSWRESSVFGYRAGTLLQREEGQFLEFKSLWDRDATSRKVLDRRKVRDAIAEYVAAFANADGGTLVLGVEDDGAVAGHGYPKRR